MFTGSNNGNIWDWNGLVIEKNVQVRISPVFDLTVSVSRCQNRDTSPLGPVSLSTWKRHLTQPTIPFSDTASLYQKNSLHFFPTSVSEQPKSSPRLGRSFTRVHHEKWNSSGPPVSNLNNLQLCSQNGYEAATSSSENIMALMLVQKVPCMIKILR